ncbi:hypothetical protein HY750_00770 [Candidatus Kuenenbacteria bacterium]|nr:hypothetical protein [Candidatus Kuenenbacteria bacterium]
MFFTPSARDCYDCTLWGENSELLYECSSVAGGVNRIKFCYRCYLNCSNIEYSNHCHSSSNLFGCVGLRHKEYCILNKQYTKEEYEKLVPKIIKHMNEMPYISKTQISNLKTQDLRSLIKKWLKLAKIEFLLIFHF